MKGGYVIADFKNISIVKTNKTIDGVYESISDAWKQLAKLPDNIVYIEMYDYKCDVIKCDYPLEVRMVKADSIARVNNIDNVALVGTNRNGTIDESTISKYFTFDINSDEWRSKIDSLSTHK